MFFQAVKAMKSSKVIVRLYEELNNYVPFHLRKRDIEFFFENCCSIKDILDSWNIPLTNIDLILLNRRSVNSDSLIKDGDRISFYPVFESFNISELTKLRDHVLRCPTFIADVHLGKLARLLRIFGFDTLFRPDFEDDEIIRISLIERRIILSKDNGLLQHKSVTHALKIHSQYPQDQLKEVIYRLDIKDDIQAFRLCSLCNSLLFTVEKEKIQTRLRPKTIEYFNEFYICKLCDKIYWKGSHYNRMRSFLDEFLD